MSPAPYDYSASSGYARARPDWADFPATSTPIQQTHLDRLDQAVKDIKTTRLNVRDYGAVGNGTTNDHTAFQNALNDLGNGGGGTLLVEPGRTYRVDGQLATVDTGSGNYPPMRGIRITGDVGYAAGQALAPYGGAILDMRSTTSPGMIYTRGIGLLEIDHLTFRNESSATNPFVYTTGTTLRIHDCAFHGQATKSQETCDQDAIILGGATTTEDGTSAQPFQGYGTVIRDNHFGAIRRMVYLRTYCNAVSIRDNWAAHTCGSDLAGGAAIEILGVSTNACVGNMIIGNQIEMLGYPYGVKAEYGSNNVIGPNSFYDPGDGTGSQATTLAYYRTETNGVFNLFIIGFSDDTLPTLSQASATGDNTLLTSHQSQRSLFPQGVRVGHSGDTSNTLLSNGNGRIVTAARMEVASLGVANSASATTPGSVVKKIQVFDGANNSLGYIAVYSAIT